MVNHPSQVAFDGEDTSCFTRFVLGKVGYFSHNTLRVGAIRALWLWRVLFISVVGDWDIAFVAIAK